MIDRKIFQVTDQIWCVRRHSYLTCSYAVKLDSGGVVLIDAGMDSAGLDIRALLEAMSATPADVKGILLTHWHNDHAAGASSLQKEVGCPVYCHVNEEKYLTHEVASLGIRNRIVKLIPEWGPGVLLIGLLGQAVPNAVSTVKFVRQNDLIEDEFRVIETPGHTPGHLSFYHEPTKTLFAGDALAILNGEIRFMAKFVTPDHNAARISMIRCLELPLNCICPGHREPLTVNVSEKCRVKLAIISQNSHWPLFG